MTTSTAHRRRTMRTSTWLRPSTTIVRAIRLVALVLILISGLERVSVLAFSINGSPSSSHHHYAFSSSVVCRQHDESISGIHHPQPLARSRRLRHTNNIPHSESSRRIQRRWCSSGNIHLKAASPTLLFLSDGIIPTPESILPSNIIMDPLRLLGPAQDLIEQQPFVAAAGAMGALFLASSTLLLAPSSASSLVNDQTLATIVKGTFLEGKELQCVYKATRDGWSATAFHSAVDERGSAVVVAQASSPLFGPIFGGYNPAGWRSTDDYVLSSSAFLWCLSGPRQKRMVNVKKYPILSAGNAAIFDYATSGPNFGSVDLQIGPPRAAIMGGFAGPDMENTAANAGNLRQCKATPGFAYDSDAQWPVRGTCNLVQVEVYCRKQ